MFVQELIAPVQVENTTIKQIQLANHAILIVQLVPPLQITAKLAPQIEPERHVPARTDFSITMLQIVFNVVINV